MIVAAAIKHEGTVYALPAPARHHNIIEYMVVEHGYERVPGDAEQGFIDSQEGFVERERAACIALENEQVAKLHSPPWLFSEDLW